MLRSRRDSSDRLRDDAAQAASPDLARRHVLLGWWTLLVFLSLGGVLEVFHGLKIGWYLDVSSATRRLMWTLAHAHGVLLGLTNVAFGVTLRAFDVTGGRRLGVASPCLGAATVLLPAGFLLGGVVIHSGDPGLGIVLAPLGAGFLFVAVLLTARSL